MLRACLPTVCCRLGRIIGSLPGGLWRLRRDCRVGLEEGPRRGRGEFRGWCCFHELGLLSTPALCFSGLDFVWACRRRFCLRLPSCLVQGPLGSVGVGEAIKSSRTASGSLPGILAFVVHYANDAIVIDGFSTSISVARGPEWRDVANNTYYLVLFPLSFQRRFYSKPSRPVVFTPTRKNSRPRSIVQVP